MSIKVSLITFQNNLNHSYRFYNLAIVYKLLIITYICQIVNQNGFPKRKILNTDYMILFENVHAKYSI